ncbi:hypothetical protein BKA65DRAFT_73476 [Rhexocercosporidium sp. MPI-PUGE-AT-0058]|nr:hypothetical protein BKA65DRAFT_73476 [Rhexocercosporidium sp. MPI-PUGE-AT-0058]
MKLILTGCTGFIGGEVLFQALRNPAISSIITLSRRKLADSIINNAKVTSIVVEDFKTYPESTLKVLTGADACIWCMGTTAGDKVLEIDYPLAFAKAITSTFPQSRTKFRYIHLSGGLSVRDQDKPLWFKGDLRRLKGQAEQNMLDFAKTSETQGVWETLIVKAGFVTSKEGRSPRDIVGWMMGSKASISLDEIAAVLIDSTLNGWEEDTLEDNEIMVRKGRQALKKVNESRASQ